MSSMHHKTLRALCSAALLVAPPAPAFAEDAEGWDDARANMVAMQPGPAAANIARWQRLYGDTGADLPFAEYAGFLIANPGYPDEATLRARAEQRLRGEFVPAETLIGFFNAFAPVTNFGRAHFAIALHDAGRPNARSHALEAWRGGEMSETAEASIFASFGSEFTVDDNDARMDALLWQRDRAAAQRQLARVSDARRTVFAARLAILQGGDGATSDPAAASDPGYLYNRSRELRQEGRAGEAVRMIVDGPPLAFGPRDATLWVTEMLTLAREASARDAARIAARLDEAFEADADISQRGFRLRDDYTSLMWHAGTGALWRLGDGVAAAPLFYRYGAAARTPQTRSKGFFWAGEASRRAGNAADAERYYTLAADYPDRFYGQLALARLGRAMPPLTESPSAQPTEAERAAFRAQPLTAAVSEVARDAPWATGIRFYRAMAEQAEGASGHVVVADFAREIGRRDLAVITGEAAAADGHRGFTRIGYPRLATPPGTNWTMIHALARQESQFAENAISHAGARGLMQFMPGTARDEARLAGLPYSAERLIADPAYSMQLGSNHIERLLRTYNGSYPLAIAAYNAGPGNVNRWLRENGDPRTGAVDWLQWIEEIPFTETRNYVQRVVENAVVYEALYPEDANVVRPRTVEDFLR